MNVAPQIARAVRVPFVANSVAPLRLAYGELDVEAPAERFDSYTALYFLVDGDGSLGRVTFEGLDAVRAARGEILPYGLAAPLRADDWVFTVDPSLWLAERDEYEVKQYSTPLLGTHQHYVFQMHDEFAEVIAQGIWVDIADPVRPFDRIEEHPLARLAPELPADRFQSQAGIEWELRRSPRSEIDLVRDSELCSQRLWQFNLILDGRSTEGASIWLRTVDRQLTSRFVRPSPSRQLAECAGVAQPGDFAEPWATCLTAIAERRRKSGL